MSNFLIRSATSQSSNYPIVLTRLGGPHSRHNPHLKFVEMLSDMLTPRPIRRSKEHFRNIKNREIEKSAVVPHIWKEKYPLEHKPVLLKQVSNKLGKYPYNKKQRLHYKS